MLLKVESSVYPQTIYTFEKLQPPTTHNPQFSNFSTFISRNFEYFRNKWKLKITSTFLFKKYFREKNLHLLCWLWVVIQLFLSILHYPCHWVVGHRLWVIGGRRGDTTIQFCMISSPCYLQICKITEIMQISHSTNTKTMHKNSRGKHRENHMDFIWFYLSKNILSTNHSELG